MKLALALGLLLASTSHAQSSGNFFEVLGGAPASERAIPQIPSYAGLFDYGTITANGTGNGFISNTLYTNLVRVSHPTTINSLGAKFSTTGTAVTWRAGLYTNNPLTNRPQTLLTSTGLSTVSTTSQPAWAPVSPSIVVAPGWYWAAFDISATAMPNTIVANTASIGHTMYAGDASGTILPGSVPTQAYTEALNVSLNLPATAHATPSRTTATTGALLFFAP